MSTHTRDTLVTFHEALDELLVNEMKAKFPHSLTEVAEYEWYIEQVENAIDEDLTSILKAKLPQVYLTARSVQQIDASIGFTKPLKMLMKRNIDQLFVASMHLQPTKDFKKVLYMVGIETERVFDIVRGLIVEEAHRSVGTVKLTPAVLVFMLTSSAVHRGSWHPGLIPQFVDFLGRSAKELHEVLKQTEQCVKVVLQRLWLKIMYRSMCDTPCSPLSLTFDWSNVAMKRQRNE